MFFLSPKNLPVCSDRCFWSCDTHKNKGQKFKEQYTIQAFLSKTAAPLSNWASRILFGHARKRSLLWPTWKCCVCSFCRTDKNLFQCLRSPREPCTKSCNALGIPSPWAEPRKRRQWIHFHLPLFSLERCSGAFASTNSRTQDSHACQWQRKRKASKGFVAGAQAQR